MILYVADCLAEGLRQFLERRKWLGSVFPLVQTRSPCWQLHCPRTTELIQCCCLPTLHERSTQYYIILTASWGAHSFHGTTGTDVSHCAVSTGALQRLTTVGLEVAGRQLKGCCVHLQLSDSFCQRLHLTRLHSTSNTSVIITDCESIYILPISVLITIFQVNLD